MLLAKKKNMTQIFDENGIVSPATILDFSSCRIIKGQKKSGDFIGVGNKKKPSKSEIGKYGESVPEYAVQTSQDAVIELNPGDIVNVTSISKGKGLAGVVRMWNFKGGRRTHGQSDRERRPGSIGAGTTMGRVLPGLKMARNKGNERVKIRKVKVLEVNNDEKLLVLKGSIPGTYNSVVEIIKS